MHGMQELVVKRSVMPRERNRSIAGGYLRWGRIVHEVEQGPVGTRSRLVLHFATRFFRRMATQADVVVAAEPKKKLGGIEVGPPAVRRALVLSFWDGAFATTMIAL